MGVDKFFDESTEQSEVKTRIVSKYFWAWANVVIPSAKKFSNKIAYIDLFAGPGRYKDGTASTPLLILEKAIQDKNMRDMLITIFNDKDSNNTKTLEKAIQALPGIDKLKYQPQIKTEEIGTKIVEMFEKMKLIPTLFFVDPWGYKGLSLRLINSVLKDWGCDCIIFFNYTRINMGLDNEGVKEHMNALFGEERTEKLREKMKALKPLDREFMILEEIVEALQEMGGKFVLPFCFKNNIGTRTSHHLIFVSKDFKGYEIMKEIMATESTTTDQGVPSFIYCPVDKKQPLLFELTRPLDELSDLLLKEFKGQTLTMVDIYRRHSIGKSYIKRNYKEILLQLEKAGKLDTDPPASRRRKNTFADNVSVTFKR